MTRTSTSYTRTSDRENTTIIQLMMSQNDSSTSNDLLKYSGDDRSSGDIDLFKGFPTKYIILHGLLMILVTVTLFFLKWHHFPSKDNSEIASFSAAVTFSSIFFSTLAFLALYLGFKNSKTVFMITFILHALGFPIAIAGAYLNFQQVRHNCIMSFRGCFKFPQTIASIMHIIIAALSLILMLVLRHRLKVFLIKIRAIE